MLLALAGKCGFFGASGSSAGAGASANRPFVEQRRQAEGADADAAIAEELAAGAVLEILFRQVHRTPPRTATLPRYPPSRGTATASKKSHQRTIGQSLLAGLIRVGRGPHPRHPQSRLLVRRIRVLAAFSLNRGLTRAIRKVFLVVNGLTASAAMTKRPTARVKRGKGPARLPAGSARGTASDWMPMRQEAGRRFPICPRNTSWGIFLWLRTAPRPSLQISSARPSSPAQSSETAARRRRTIPDSGT